MSESFPTSDAGATEYRIFGPPGTGKTTYLGRQVVQAVERFGSERVLVTSFTRAAAAELVGRDLPVTRDRIGTLHSHCYRAIGTPELAETKTEDWNKEFPQYSISGAAGDGTLDEGAVDQVFKQPADELFGRLHSLRGQMVPEELWPISVRAMARHWQEWKARNGFIDFTDMLEIALRDIHIAPGDPHVIIADEAQDFSKLQLSLLRQWGKHTDYMLVAGDEDQLLYGWCGCTVDAFLKPEVPETQKRVLRQSYRVPRAVHAIAQRWVKTLRVREPKEYMPRDADGEARELKDGSWRNPDPLLVDAAQYLERGTTVMFLASCSYMLEAIKGLLRAEGVPFHNPYRTRRYDWNPLRRGENTTAARLVAFLRPREDVWGDEAGEWCADDLRRWVGIMKADGLLVRGGKAEITKLSADARVSIQMIARLFQPDAAERMIRVLSEGSLQECVAWLQEHILAANEKAAQYPAAIITKRGPRALVERPKVILGTIHSVKGGEADVVYLVPDLSSAANEAWSVACEGRDAIIRQMYVGMTRARESLILCAPASKAYADMGAFLNAA